MTFTKVHDEEVTVRAAFVGRVTDGFTKRPPPDGFSATLWVDDAADQAEFRPSGHALGRTPHGNFYFHGLRAPLAGSSRVATYRIVVDPARRRPWVPLGQPDIRFTLSAAQPKASLHLTLLPGPGYHYPVELPLASGVVVRGGSSVPDAIVRLAAPEERCLTDAAGAFRLCLRYAPVDVPFTIHASDRTGASAALTFASVRAATAGSIRFELPA